MLQMRPGCECSNRDPAADTSTARLRDYLPTDAVNVNALAVHAFEQFKDAYADWPVFRSKIATMSALAQTGEIVVAELDGRIAGAVAYVGPGKPKADFFRPEWPIMRMLVVAPGARGHGVGRALAHACLDRARRDGAAVFALHTSELMQVALPMYRRMGFSWFSTAPAIHGVAYDVYTKGIMHAGGSRS
ncbi:MAG TPA: GNAT family N-acetyltransferase [Telluria sp.]